MAVVSASSEGTALGGPGRKEPKPPVWPGALGSKVSNRRSEKSSGRMEGLYKMDCGLSKVHYLAVEWWG